MDEAFALEVVEKPRTVEATLAPWIAGEATAWTSPSTFVRSL